MLRQIAIAAAVAGEANHLAQLMPISAALRLLPTKAQGWAKGLAGKANSKTADAPIGAISQTDAA